MRTLLPKPLSHVYQLNIMIQDHDTRQRNNPHVERSHTSVEKKLTSVRAPVIMGSATT